MKENDKNFWFPAKRYGWGWGMPNRWQGLVVLGIWIAVFTAGQILLLKYLALCLGFTAVMIAILFAICFLKGEKPRWRWGDDSDKPKS